MKNSDIISRGCSCADGSEEKIKSCIAGSCAKLEVYDWLNDIPGKADYYDIVEVRFKNTRKGFYQNVNKLKLKTGDIIAVEASPGHDIGVISLTGPLIMEQLDKYDVDLSKTELKKVYRHAKPVDIEKWYDAIELEKNTMIRSRVLASNLNLDMKIGDVEYQGDKTKAIFYYIANDRVDFRELIKVLADEFKVRIEMKQIGARQEAGRIGGIGSCGRELCCSTWMTDFVSVTTNSARYQEVSLNPQKLAGQCGKLKCCLNYEMPVYEDARKHFPNSDIILESEEGRAHHMKTDVFRGMMWYSVMQDGRSTIFALTVNKVKEIIEMNKKGEKPAKLSDHQVSAAAAESDFASTIMEDSLTRFDNDTEAKKNPRRKKKFRKKRKPNQGLNQNPGQGNKQNSGSNPNHKPRPNNNRDRKKDN